MAEPNPILRVTVDVPVYTQDGAKIGKVGEVRGGAFKVQTGLLQRDYWLKGESIATAVSGEAVMLAVTKADLAAQKVAEPAKAA